MRKTEDDGVYSSTLNLKTIRLDRIVPDENRPLRSFSEASLADLGRSLVIHGQLVPIVVHYLSDEDTFVLVDGERRWRAAQQVGLQTLQAIILGRLSTEQRYEWEVVCALHQRGWDAGERAQALHLYKARKGLATWDEVAQNLGISRATLDAFFQGEPTAVADVNESGKDIDAVSQAVATASLIDRVLSRLQPGESDPAEVAQILNDLEDCLAEHRARLVHSRAKEPPEEKGKPVRYMPTWG